CRAQEPRAGAQGRHDRRRQLPERLEESASLVRLPRRARYQGRRSDPLPRAAELDAHGLRRARRQGGSRSDRHRQRAASRSSRRLPRARLGLPRGPGRLALRPALKKTFIGVYKAMILRETPGLPPSLAALDEGVAWAVAFQRLAELAAPPAVPCMAWARVRPGQPLTSTELLRSWSCVRPPRLSSRSSPSAPAPLRRRRRPRQRRK